MTARYSFTPLAELDLDRITAYSVEEWGAAQAIDYVKALRVRVRWLAERPGVGKVRPEIGEGVRSFPEKSHLIFYRETGALVEILRIRHNAEDLTQGWQDLP